MKTYVCVLICYFTGCVSFPFYQNDAALVYLNEPCSNLECCLRAQSFVVLKNDTQV